MRKIIFSIPITVDGFIEGPNHELTWVVADDELHDFYASLLQSADLILYGRITYELMVSYWPTAPTDPQATKSEKRFANTLNPMRKIVFSKTVKPKNWNTQLIESFNPEEIRQMKETSGGDILLGGGATIAQEFIRNGLVDEYIPVIQPVAIGQGKALFHDIPKMLKLDFQWSKPFASGAVALCYSTNGRTKL